MEEPRQWMWTPAAQLAAAQMPQPPGEVRKFCKRNKNGDCRVPAAASLRHLYRRADRPKGAQSLEAERASAQAAVQATRSAQQQTKVSHKKLNQVKVSASCPLPGKCISLYCAFRHVSGPAEALGTGSPDSCSVGLLTAEHNLQPALHSKFIGMQELLVMHFKELERAGQLVNTFGDVQAHPFPVVPLPASSMSAFTIWTWLLGVIKCLPWLCRWKSFHAENCVHDHRWWWRLQVAGVKQHELMEWYFARQAERYASTHSRAMSSFTQKGIDHALQSPCRIQKKVTWSKLCWQGKPSQLHHEA